MQDVLVSTAKLICCALAAHDEARTEAAAAPLLQQIEEMLANTEAGKTCQQQCLSAWQHQHHADNNIRGYAAILKPTLSMLRLLLLTCLLPNAGFQSVPALEHLEGMLNSFAPAHAEASSLDENSMAGNLQKPAALVQHKGAVGFLQAFLKLQQGLSAFNNKQEAHQVQLNLTCPSHSPQPVSAVMSAAGVHGLCQVCISQASNLSML